jgi:hypothetical protein
MHISKLTKLKVFFFLMAKYIIHKKLKKNIVQKLKQENKRDQKYSEPNKSIT